MKVYRYQKLQSDYKFAALKLCPPENDGIKFDTDMNRILWAEKQFWVISSEGTVDFHTMKIEGYNYSDF